VNMKRQASSMFVGSLPAKTVRTDSGPDCASAAIASAGAEVAPTSTMPSPCRPEPWPQPMQASLLKVHGYR